MFTRKKVQTVLLPTPASSGTSHDRDVPSSVLISNTTEEKYQYSEETAFTPNGGNNSKFGKFGKLFTRKKKTTKQLADKQISKKLNQEQNANKATIQILLLGAGGSGKSTILKNMEKFYGYLDEKEMEYANHEIRQNVLMDIIDLCKFNIKLNANSFSAIANANANISQTQTQKSSNKNISIYKLGTQELQEMCIRMANYNDIDELEGFSESLTNEIAQLWNDNAIKHTWELRKKSHIMDNTHYFLSKIKSVSKSDYRVSFDDYIRVRDRTTGIVQKSFVVNEYRFQVTDVGGQRSERRKWMTVFDNVNVVMYVMNLAGYDQVLFEDNSKNCLNESLDLFSKTSSIKKFIKTDWIVFLNKIDIFNEKIDSVPFTVYKKDFNDKCKHNGTKVQEFIIQEFKNRFYENLSNQTKRMKGKLYFHVTCAIHDVSSILKKVQFDILQSGMNSAFLL